MIEHGECEDAGVEKATTASEKLFTLEGEAVGDYYKNGADLGAGLIGKLEIGGGAKGAFDDIADVFMG